MTVAAGACAGAAATSVTVTQWHRDRDCDWHTGTVAGPASTSRVTWQADSPGPARAGVSHAVPGLDSNFRVK